MSGFMKIGSSVILLPLLPASLRHENPQRRKIIILWYASHRMQRSIEPSEDVFVECPVCVICSSQGRADMKDQGWKGLINI